MPQISPSDIQKAHRWAHHSYQHRDVLRRRARLTHPKINGYKPGTSDFFHASLHKTAYYKEGEKCVWLNNTAENRNVRSKTVEQWSRAHDRVMILHNQPVDMTPADTLKGVAFRQGQLMAALKALHSPSIIRYLDTLRCPSLETFTKIYIYK